MAKSRTDIMKAVLAGLKRMAGVMTHNWVWKLLSLILAIFLWSTLITQDESLTREKTFTDVSISVINADALRRNGYIIVSGLDALPTLRLRAEVPQRMYNTVTSNNYNVRVDLSRIRGAGEQMLSVLSTNSATYGTVTEMSPAVLPVQVEEYVTRSRIPVRLNISGTAPEGFYAGEASVDPSYVTVAGPASLVNRVVRCVADYSMNALEPISGIERTAVPFRLVDAGGNEVDQRLIDVSAESIRLDSMVVEQTLYTARELVVNTTDLVTGQPKAGYVIKRITAEPPLVTLAGGDDKLAALNEVRLIDYIAQAISVNDASATIHRNIRLNKPAGIAYISTDTVLVTIEIEPQ